MFFKYIYIKSELTYKEQHAPLRNKVMCSEWVVEWGERVTVAAGANVWMPFCGQPHADSGIGTVYMQ